VECSHVYGPGDILLLGNMVSVYRGEGKSPPIHMMYQSTVPGRPRGKKGDRPTVIVVGMWRGEEGCVSINTGRRESEKQHAHHKGDGTLVHRMDGESSLLPYILTVVSPNP